MVNIKNFTAGSPRTPEQLVLANKHKVLFLFSEDGQDWYEAQKHYAAETIKIAYDKEKVIRSISRDVSMLFPLNMSVAEVPDTTANRRADISGRWGFDGENIIDLLTPEKARQQQHEAVNRWRDEQESAVVTFEYAGHRWDASKASQTRLALVMALSEKSALPLGFYWTDADNQDVPVTLNDLIALEQGMTEAIVKQGWAIHARQRDMKKEIDALITVAQIRQYPIGWPPRPE